MAHPDLPAEQAHLDRAYGRLEAVRAETQARLHEAFREKGGTFQSYTERDIRVRNALSRLEQLQVGREALVFGRIDRARHSQDRIPQGEGDGPTLGLEGGEAYHIGRLALSDADHEPLVVDWRAPVAEPFYRATGAHPMGLRRRRHFLTEGRTVVDLEDELFALEGEDAEGAALGPGLAGPSVLMAALERAHTGRMRDIVATVQAEQDEVIRAPLPGVLVVQGGPGTGKTAVALHRAAYLLYTHRFPLEAQGVLVVGPNPTFLHYIEQVLPSLGETGVELSTAGGLYRGTATKGPAVMAAVPAVAEDPAKARLKGDPRMARVLRRALRQRERPLRQAVTIAYGRAVLSLTPQESEEIVRAARRRPGTHNSRRRLLEASLWERLARQLEMRAKPSSRVSPGELGAELRRRPDVAELLERMWPRLTPESFLHDLFGAKPLIEAAGRGILSTPEVEMLFRARSTSSREVRWEPSDTALLDEADSLLGPLRALSSPQASGPAPDAAGRAPGRGDGPQTYGHVVVDEVQDLTPMQLRMVGRRSLAGSMTLVGDIAQATGPWAPASWDQIVAHLPTRRGWRVATLSVNYRAPAEVMALASRVLAAALPGATAPEAVRSTGWEPRVVSLSRLGRPTANGSAVWGGSAGSDGSDAGDDAWRALVGRTVNEEVGILAGLARGDEGNLGVLVPVGLLPETRAALEALGTDYGEVGARALDARVSLLALRDAKGLEFDSVVVVEPARIVAEAPEGLRALYVALTRCTRRLAIVHREPLPAPLQPDGRGNRYSL
ncbi:MAG TPA: hypothetical protein VED59_07445 [Acidimicrobiales bacterium]|nr:hypothetical protein [Acidimicrobiales bacterium]